MADVNNTQAAFMENMNALKEYAKVNGGIITKEDVINYFKDIELDDQKLQMIYGYLMANNIKVQGELNVDNQFLKLMESAVEKDKVNAGEEPDQKDAIDTDIEQASDESNKNTKVHNYNPEDEAQDQKYIEIYLEDLSHM
jgi:RNA polymerase primary sigma factor